MLKLVTGVCTPGGHCREGDEGQQIGYNHESCPRTQVTSAASTPPPPLMTSTTSSDSEETLISLRNEKHKQV